MRFSRCLLDGGGRSGDALCIFNGQLCVQHGQKHRERHFIAEIGIVREGGSVRVESEKYHPCRVFPQLKGYWYVVVPTNVTIVTSIIPQLKAAEGKDNGNCKPGGKIKY